MTEILEDKRHDFTEACTAIGGRITKNNAEALQCEIEREGRLNPKLRIWAGGPEGESAKLVTEDGSADIINPEDIDVFGDNLEIMDEEIEDQLELRGEY